jgi:hypothetical protein
MMLGHTVLHRRTFALDKQELHLPEHLEMIDATKVKVLPLEIVNGKVYKYAPPGSTVLSLPFIAIAGWFHLSPVDANGLYDQGQELRLSSILAALLMSAFSVLCFFFCRLLLPIPASLAVTLTASLGTQVWSTASRVVEPDTWTVLLLMFALSLLAANELGRVKLRPVLLATVLSWCYFVHPTTAISIAAIAVYVWLYHRQYFLRFFLTGLAWCLALVVYSWRNFGQLLPNYFQANRLGFKTFWEALPGNVVSPSRGLFIYVPVLVLIAVMLIYYWRILPLKRLVTAGVFVVVIHLLVISGFSHWWAGHSYGPRYWTSVVPWFVLFGSSIVKAIQLQSHSSAGRPVQAIALAGLAFAGILIHARGALSQDTRVWNAKPYDIDLREGRLWNWRYPQFLAGLVSPPLPAGMYPTVAVNTRIDLVKEDANRFLWYGWSNPESTYRWTDGKKVAFIFSLEKNQELTVTIRATPFTASGLKDEQNFTFNLNGRPLQTVTLEAGGSRDIVLRLPQASIKSENVISIECPDADSPANLGLSQDARLLGLAVEWIEFKSE